MVSASSESRVTGETPVAVDAGRLRFTVEYKSWVVQEAERLRGSGDVGGFLRREGIFFVATHDVAEAVSRRGAAGVVAPVTALRRSTGQCSWSVGSRTLTP
jgi:hypothetical protein